MAQPGCAAGLRRSVTGAVRGLKDAVLKIGQGSCFSAPPTADSALAPVRATASRTALQPPATRPSQPAVRPTFDPLRTLTGEQGHPMVVVGSGRLTDARRAFQKLLAEAGRPCVHADDAPMLRDLEHDVQVEHGQPQRTDGPFRQLLATGGTLLLNLGGDDGAPRFTPQQLESLNTLMEEQIWDGQPIGCRDKGERVNIVFLVDEHTPLTQIASGALTSRVTLCDAKAHPFEDAPDPPIHPARSHAGTDALVIDLHDDATSWQRTLLGGPELTADQTWRHGAGALEGFDFSQQVLVLRNPPRDPRLMDQVLALQARHPDAIRLEDGLPAEEAAERLARKQPAADLAQVLQARPDTVCVLHPGNIDEVLAGSYGVRDGALAQLPSALAQAQEKAGERTPVVLVSEPLGAKMWDRLMQHPAHFAVAAAPGVTVDPRYAPHVTQASPAAPAPAPDMQELSRPGTWQAAVTFLHCADPTLVDPSLPAGATRIHLTATTRSDDLLYSLQRSDAGPEGSGLPGLQVQTHQLIEDLKAGKTVVLHGLENNRDLARDLAPLLHPPHAPLINGERVPFEGRLIVVSPDRRLIERHGLTPALADPAPAGDAWRQAVAARLAAGLSLPPARAQALLAPVLEWFDTLSQAGVVSRQQPPVRYATVETLCRTLSKLQAAGPATEPGQAALLRSLLKDMVIGDHRRQDVVHDTRYAQLKACLKVVLAADTSAMPPQSVELARLQDLLGQVRHPKDIEALAWPFLNAFSPDVIGQVIGQPVSAAVHPGAQKKIGAKVLDLVCAQARAHGLSLPPLVAQWPEKPSPVAVKHVHVRATSLPRDEKLTGKVRQAEAQGIFLKGPPGAGKTHLVETLTHGKPVFWASIADEGTAAFGAQLQAWATSRPAGTLVIDEANLALPENLAMLKGVFADRSLHVNGRVHALEADHRIIFTGNADSLAGRSRQQVAQESFTTVQFKSMEAHFLRKAFVEPVLERACATGPLAGMKAEVAQMGHQALHIHERLQQVFLQAGLSPRDLEELLARGLTQLGQLGQSGQSGPLGQAPQRGAASQRPDPQALLASVALEVYGASLPADCQGVVQAWLRHELKLPQEAALPALFDAAAIGRALQAQELAPTASTVALAGAVDGWLRSQAAREAFNPKDTTLGKRALLIEGPASRGKDAVCKATLQAQGLREGIDFVHINANPGDLDGLREAVGTARERGQVVLVSELNLLPSGILEGELNTLLTGQAGQPAAAGFALIATINPGYAGRQDLSAALQNRMHKLTLGDYPADELLPIARAHAARLAAAGPSTSASGSPPATLRPAVADHQVKELVQQHVALLARLTGQSGEFKPGIRQLRDALALLAQRPTMSMEQVIDIPYGFYRQLAEQAANAPADSTAAQQERVVGPLRSALALAHPGTCEPGWRGDPALSRAIPVVYDAARHELRFRPDTDPEELTSYLLDQVRQERLFVGRVATDEVQRTDGTAPAAPAAPTAPNGANAPNTATASTAPTAPTAMPEPAAAIAPASTEPVHFRPSRHHRSGVASADRPGHIGRIEQAGPEAIYLATSRTAVGGRDWAWAERREDNTGVGRSSRRPRITLDAAPAERVDGQLRVYVPVPAGQRPTAVRLGEHQPATVQRDAQGGWFVVAPNAGQGAGGVSYSLVDDGKAKAEKDQTLPGLPSKFPNLARAFNGPLAEKISALSTGRARMSDIDLAKELATIFRTTLEYSDGDAEALERTTSVGERCERFLTVGQGVCHEFANSYAAVLMQSFGIAARLCHGHVARPGTGEIAAQAHVWVEVRDAKGQWHGMEPTSSDDRRSAARRSAPQRAGGVAGATAAGQAADLMQRLEDTTPTDPAPARAHKPATGPNLFNEVFAPELLEGISLDALGLTRREVKRGGVEYHPTSGVLELKRAIAGEPDMFRRAALNDTAEPRPLIIDSLQPAGGPEAWPGFWAVMARPLAALQKKGVPILMRDNHGALQPAAFIHDIEARCKSGSGEPGKPGAVSKDGAVVIGQQGQDMLDKLAAAYYESLLRTHAVDPRRMDDVKLCILADLSTKVSDKSTPWPIELPLHGQRVVIAEADLDSLWSSARQDIERLAALDSPPGRFAQVVAAGGDALRDVEDTLARAAQVLSLRDLMVRSAGTPLKERMTHLVRTFVEHSPSLGRSELIGHLSNEIEWDNSGNSRRMTLTHDRLLTDLLSTSKSMTAAAREQVACDLTQALGRRSLAPDSHAALLDHLEQHALAMPATRKAKLLRDLTSAASTARWSMDTATLARCRALCMLLADAADGAVPEDLQRMGSMMTFAYHAGDDFSTKTWALSLLDKFSRAMQPLPMDANHGMATFLSEDLARAKLTAVEHQRAAAEVLERLLDSHDASTAGPLPVIDRSLASAIRDGLISPELAPRFEALRARVTEG
jgi:MoxR-like ATPase